MRLRCSNSKDGEYCVSENDVKTWIKFECIKLTELADVLYDEFERLKSRLYKKLLRPAMFMRIGMFTSGQENESIGYKSDKSVISTSDMMKRKIREMMGLENKSIFEKTK